jgi:hypothetical protein
VYVWTLFSYLQGRMRRLKLFRSFVGHNLRKTQKKNQMQNQLFSTCCLFGMMTEGGKVN